MDVLNSKSFWSSIAAIVAMVIVSYVPELAPHEETIVRAIGALGVALVIGHKTKDVALAFIEAWLNKTSIADELEELNVEADIVAIK